MSLQDTWFLINCIQVSSNGYDENVMPNTSDDVSVEMANSSATHNRQEVQIESLPSVPADGSYLQSIDNTLASQDSEMDDGPQTSSVEMKVSDVPLTTTEGLPSSLPETTASTAVQLATDVPEETPLTPHPMPTTIPQANQPAHSISSSPHVAIPAPVAPSESNANSLPPENTQLPAVSATESLEDPGIGTREEAADVVLQNPMFSTISATPTISVVPPLEAIKLNNLNKAADEVPQQSTPLPTSAPVAIPEVPQPETQGDIST